jgi:hypothetical protein
MRRFLRAICTLSLAVSMATPAAAERTVAVNDPASPGVFDQPSAAVRGNTVHVTYIGADNTAGPFRVFYAAVNGGANFTDLSLTRTTPGFLVTQPAAIDNTDPGNDAYADARHPRIAMLSSTEAVILFQGKPTASPDPTYVLYLARLTLDNNVVVNRSVRMVTGVSGFNEDVSFALVTSDNTARVAYAGRTATTGNFDVFYARISLDTAAVTGTPGTPMLLSSVAGSTGFRPLPSLKLDSSSRAHVAWAANSASSTPNGVYYAMVDETSGADNVVIAATEILGRSRKWGHPNVLVARTTSIVILAGDETLPEVAGNLGMVNINPNADDRDGDPVEVRRNTDFLLTPPGEAILPDGFSLFRPEAFRDSLGAIHTTGYGSNGTRATYFAFTITSSSPFAQFKRIPAPVGLDSSEFPVSLPDGDYTRAALGFLTGGKVVVFWSGEVTGTGNRNLDVTALPTSTAIAVDESGCTVEAAPRAEETGRNADALLLLLPAAVLWIRRAMRQPIEE